jgi:dihydrodipicolinate synthase/N-acetylneuraminate lyase
MKTSGVTLEDLAASVVAVPPLARHEDLTLNRGENAKLIKHIEAGGITTFLYGGNASFFDLPFSEYATTLEFLAGAVSAGTWLIPSAGPDYGKLIDQVVVLRDLPFPTAMALPQTAPSTPSGVMTGVRKFVERLGRPVIVYIKSEGYLEPRCVQQLFDDGLLYCVKYAVERPDPTDDDYLRELLDRIDRRRVVSGIGERPAVAHVRTFGLTGFTSGLASIAPSLSNRLLRALQRHQDQDADALRAAFLPMEDCRDTMGPIRALHDSVTLAGIADMGPMLPLLHNLEEGQRPPVARLARALLDQELASRC